MFAFECSVIRPPTCIHAMLKRLCLSVNQKPYSCGSPPLSDDLQKRLSKMFILDVLCSAAARQCPVRGYECSEEITDIA